MKIKSKFNIGQKVYVTVFGDRIDEVEIKEIIYSSNGIIYNTTDGRIEEQDEIFESYDDAVDGLISIESDRHNRMIEYFNNLKKRR